MATDNVTVSKAGNKEGINCSNPILVLWCKKQKLDKCTMVSLLVLQFLPFESFTPVCSANANQQCVGCFSGNLLVMLCVVKYCGEGRTLGEEKPFIKIVQQPAGGQILLEDF